MVEFHGPGFFHTRHFVAYHTGWFFLTGPPLKMSLDWPPPKNASTGPPLLWKSSKYGG